MNGVDDVGLFEEDSVLSFEVCVRDVEGELPLVIGDV